MGVSGVPLWNPRQALTCHDGPQKISKNEILKASFDEFDENNSGTMACGELKNMFEKLKWNSDDESIQQCLQYLDKNANGKIDFNEFLKWTEFAWRHQVLNTQNLQHLGLPPRPGRLSPHGSPRGEGRGLAGIASGPPALPVFPVVGGPRGSGNSGRNSGRNSRRNSLTPLPENSLPPPQYQPDPLASLSTDTLEDPLEGLSIKP